MSYASWSVVFGEQPSASKWNILGTNDASFNDGTGIAANAVTFSQLALGVAIQTVDVVYTSTTTGTTVIPNDGTIPQNTEGNQFMTLSITPKTATSKLIVEGVCMISNTAANRLVVAMFRDSTASAVAVATNFDDTATTEKSIPFYYSTTSNSTASTTFNIRAGSPAAGTTTFNGASGAPLYGAIAMSYLKITEIKA